MKNPLPKNWRAIPKTEEEKDKIAKALDDKGWRMASNDSVFDFFKHMEVKEGLTITNTTTQGKSHPYVMFGHLEKRDKDEALLQSEEVKLLRIKLSSTIEEWEKKHMG